jgi:hypothetical protein
LENSAQVPGMLAKPKSCLRNQRPILQGKAARSARRTAILQVSSINLEVHPVQERLKLCPGFLTECAIMAANELHFVDVLHGLVQINFKPSMAFHFPQVINGFFYAVQQLYVIISTHVDLKTNRSASISDIVIIDCLVQPTFSLTAWRRPHAFHA